jgi:hypothetical protein
MYEIKQFKQQMIDVQEIPYVVRPKSTVSVLVPTIISMLRHVPVLVVKHGAEIRSIYDQRYNSMSEIGKFVSEWEDFDEITLDIEENSLIQRVFITATIEKTMDDTGNYGWFEHDMMMPDGYVEYDEETDRLKADYFTEFEWACLKAYGYVRRQREL